MRQPPQRLLHESLLFNGAGPEFASKPVAIVEGRSHTYEELRISALRLAATLQARGLKRGDRVAIYMDNTWPCIVSIYATLAAGGVFLVVNPQTKSEKLAFVLEDSGARVLLTDAHLLGGFAPVVDSATVLLAVILSGELPEGGWPCDKPMTAFDAALVESHSLQDAGTIALDLAALIYTSGSTGNPKGVMQTHQSMVFTTGSLTQYLRLSGNDRILCVLPLAFDYGLYQLLMTVSLGATLVLERSFIYPAEIYARMRETSVTVFPGVPTVFAMLTAAHARSALCFPSVTRVTNTAAALPDGFIPQLRAIFPNALIYRMYGLTECKRVCYLEPELVDTRPGSVGKAIPGTEVYLLDEADKPVLPGNTGILHVRGPHVMLGYWNQPALTAHMLKPGPLPGEKVLCTHDNFRIDSDGFLYFVGRTDDIIKTRGEKVSPVEVENVLHGIPGINEAAVIGVPDDLLGEAVRAYVVLREDATLTDRQIRALCASRLENFMVPRDVVLCAELPKTVTGKISKKLLREQGPP